MRPPQAALATIIAPERAARQPPLCAPERAVLNAAIASLALGGAERIVLDWAAACARSHLVRLTVLHNARAGWREPASALSGEALVIAVSRHVASELHATGVAGPCAVVRHVPRAPRPRPEARRAWRERWALPQEAAVIGMIGAVKPQKAYPRALRILAALLERRECYLVILGGPAGRDGPAAWRALIAQARRLGLECYLRVPGFVPDAARCLPAFDLVLNTSGYEGLSIATLEALASGLPVVASAVGGQGELPAPGLTLLAYDAPVDEWARAAGDALGTRPEPPAWRDAPTRRLWTLFHLLPADAPRRGVLFVTANLNAGGAQRSLVNLALGLGDSLRFEIITCGESTSDWFGNALERAGVHVTRGAASRDRHDHAEGVMRRLAAGRFRTLCFWNVDPGVKLLLAKALAATAVRLVDVSPGGHGFREMAATRAFQQWIAWGEDEYYARLDALVLKYRGPAPRAARGRIAVIPNGVAVQAGTATAGALVPPRIVMSGRIAPSKFVLEAVAAMHLLWRRRPRAELHLFGRAEPRHAEYARELLAAIGAELGARIFLHGAAFDAPRRLPGHAAALVLGEHQGCPNAVLEALAAGVPVVANDSGGTREMVVPGRTGLLLPDCAPAGIAGALDSVIGDPGAARRRAEAGLRRVARRYSMARMVSAYRGLLA
ncbi:MAG: glycosyltransferase [Burkholderiales bacterium]|nr:glycosyltransferase [Burkholderiales bacterium]